MKKNKDLFRIRIGRLEDLDDIQALAQSRQPGLTSLSKSPQILITLLQNSLDSIANPQTPKSFFFVLEDLKLVSNND